MDKESVLADIFANDPLKILTIKSRSAPVTSDQRLKSSFQEINDFYQTKGRVPKAKEEKRKDGFHAPRTGKRRGQGGRRGKLWLKAKGKRQKARGRNYD